MRRHCHGCRPIGPARLDGHRLVFPPTRDDDWHGAVAALAPAVGSDHWVEGVIYEIDDGGLAVLDVYEEVDAGTYRREAISVRQSDGKPREVWAYFATVDVASSQPPSRQYLDTLLRGARRHGLSRDYLARLESIPVRGENQPAAQPHRE